MNLKAPFGQPPLHPWSSLRTSQSTTSCSEKDIKLPVLSFVTLSMAATAENAQQQPIYIKYNWMRIASTGTYLIRLEAGTIVKLSYLKELFALLLSVEESLKPIYIALNSSLVRSANRFAPSLNFNPWR
ncbi:hypothetical protein IHE45_13G058800 [Dioscorea alata]|uniref:Uncharacterized protein n=1 Tax=Dioscorea alata TaxID=55571 RepID=A0ACB7UYL1_DIOAL|nr:hypothetical protein IHE45_13G058800 [Dioscorea alata]